METKVTTWPKISIDTEKDLAMCFGCGQDNPIGLKLKFNWDGKIASAQFTPDKLHQGWSRLVHGGIITVLLDEAMAYAALFYGVNTVTANMQAKFRHPAPIDKPLFITGSVINKTRRLVETRATVSLIDGTLIAEGTATQFIINTEAGGESDVRK